MNNKRRLGVIANHTPCVVLLALLMSRQPPPETKASARGGQRHEHLRHEMGSKTTALRKQFSFARHLFLLSCHARWNVSSICWCRFTYPSVKEPV